MLSEILHWQTLSGVSFAFADGITDIAILSGPGPGEAQIYTISRAGVVRFEMGPDGTLSLREASGHIAGPVPGMAPRLTGTDGGLYLSGLRPEAAGRFLVPDGGLGAAFALSGPSEPVFAMVRYADDGAVPVVIQAGAGGGLDLYRETGVGTLDPAGQGVEAALLGQVRALAIHETGPLPVILALNPETGALTAFTLEDAGSIQATGRLDAASGVGLSLPGAIAVAEVAGQAFAIVESAGAGALTVAGIGADGALWLSDHVLDTRETRFAGTVAVDAVSVGAFAFVAAGGSDDGVSLFTVLPDGRLVHLAALADSAVTTLAGTSALSLGVAGAALQILGAGTREAGLTRLSYEIAGLGAVVLAGDAGGMAAGGAADDIVAGGPGDDTLSGGGGGDILADGAGSDLMTGGPGADLFVLSGDAATDRITDFQPGADRLDLSDWRFFYGAEQLVVTPTADGAVVTFRDERIEITGAAGTPLSAEDLAAALWTAADRPPTVPVDQVLSGGAGADTLLGGIGQDCLFGGIGEDRLVGGSGDDLLMGEAGFDVLIGGDGADRIFGGAQADTAHGGAGADTIFGEDGVDTLYGDAGADHLDGGAGNDRLRGGAGDDTLAGGTQEDRLWGDAGADRLEGNAGFDRLEGGDGDDWLDGGAQADNLFGGTGDDVLLGQDGFDRLFGGPGNDWLDGGAIGDGMFGEQGNDTLLGGAGDDRLNGGPGNDLVDGGEGDDIVRGGAGFDTIVAGSGNDQLYGDFNADTFVFADGFGTDVIADFEAGNAFERIDLSGVTAIADWADLMARHLFAESDGVRIVAGADSVFLLGVTLTELDAGDFVF